MDASGLDTAISSLEKVISGLEESSGRLEVCLIFWSVLVAIGVAIEIIEVLAQHVGEHKAWRRATIRSPERPRGWMLVLKLCPVVFVTVGITGELFNNVQSMSINMKLRGKNTMLVGLIHRKASNAEEAAATAHKEAALTEQSLAPRRLSRKQQLDSGSRLRRFSRQLASQSYIVADAEGQAFAWDINEALRYARWDVFDPAGILMMAKSGQRSGRRSVIRTGVLVESTGDDHSRAACDAFIAELRNLGFDANRPPTPLDPNEGHRLVIHVESRPVGPQGEAKIALARSHN